MVDLDRKIVESADGEHRLTKLEARFLEELARANGRPVSRDHLLRNVWGYRAKVNTRSIDDLVKRLRRKIEYDTSEPEHLITVHRIGYRFVPTHGAARHRLIGREAERASVHQTLQRPAWLTILGPGGMGKTTLARAVAAAPRWRGGISADLQGVDNLEQALALIAEALGMTSRGPIRSELLAGHLADRGKTLLWLDGAEGVAPNLSREIARWREEATETRILVTSRVRLHGAEETLLELGPLTVDDAGALMWQRARAARHDLPDRPEIRETLSAVATRLDRIPLAIELAAARANLLSPSQLLTQVEHRLALLSSPARTLASVLDASWALASDEERTALQQLALFDGGFQLEDAAAVLDQPLTELLPLIQALRDQSWLRAWTPASLSELRLGMYDSIRDYISAKPADLLRTRERHARVYAQLGKEAALKAARRTVQPQSVGRYGVEHANIRVAFHAALALKRPDLAVLTWRAAHRWLHYRGPVATSIALAEQLLRAGLNPAQEALVRKSAADLHRRLGDADTAVRWARIAVERADEAQDRPLQAQTREVLAGLLTIQAQFDEAERVLDQAEPHLKGLKRWLTAATLCDRRAAIAIRRGDLNQAHQRYEEALELAHRAGDTVLPLAIENALASLARTRGDLGDAIVRYERVIEQIRAAGGDSAIAEMNLANLHTHLGNHALAEAGYQQALTSAQRMGNRTLEAAVTTNLAILILGSGDLDEAVRHLHRALAMHRQHRVPRMEAATLLALGEAALREPAAPRAERRFTEALEVAERAGLRRHMGSAALGRAQCALLQQAYDEVECWLTQADAHLAQAPHAAESARVHCVRGQMACALGDRAAAERALSGAIATAPEEAEQPATWLGRSVAILRTQINQNKV